jgi:hypothetical protein
MGEVCANLFLKRSTLVFDTDWLCSSRHDSLGEQARKSHQGFNKIPDQLDPALASKSTPITASMLYDLVTCPHRVTMDLFANPSERDAVSPFVQLLWERGAAHEKEVIAGIGDAFLDLSKYDGVEKERLTLAAMDRGESLIYSGRISNDDLLGEPDLLRKEGKGYVAGDIKSGAGKRVHQKSMMASRKYATQCNSHFTLTFLSMSAARLAAHHSCGTSTAQRCLTI